MINYQMNIFNQKTATKDFVMKIKNLHFDRGRKIKFTQMCLRETTRIIKERNYCLCLGSFTIFNFSYIK